MNPSQLPFTSTDLLVGLVLAASLGLGWAGLRAFAHGQRRRVPWYAAYWLLLCFSAELVVAAVVCNGQGVWAGLGPAGAFGAVTLGYGGHRLRAAIAEVEARRIAARDCF